MSDPRPVRVRGRFPFLKAMLLFAALLIGVLTASNAVAQQTRPPIHVQLVLDSSGSMKENDPSRLSLLAGMIFADLAGPSDSLGVVSMQKNRFVTREIAPVGENRESIRRAVEDLPFSGPTFCAEPLDAAGEGLAKLRKADAGARQFVVFLSDGACPDDHQRGPQDVRDAAMRLERAGVKVFSIGLFGTFVDAGVDPTADLRAMASVTDGEFFRIGGAGDLPGTFAAILGRIVGSEAIEVELKPGEDVSVGLDGYVYDASFVATGEGAPVIFDKAEGPGGESLKLPHRGGNATDGDGFYTAAFDNGARQHYSVLRVDEPTAGNWTFKVDGPRSLRGLLIQNYALDPVVSVGTGDGVQAVGTKTDLRGWLRGKDGGVIADAKFLEKVKFVAWVKGPDGEERELALKVGSDGKFTAPLHLDTAGAWSARGRATMTTGGLDKRTEPIELQVSAVTLALADGQGAIDLGTVKAGTSVGPHTIDLGGSEVYGAETVTLRLEGVSNATLSVTQAEITPGSTTVTESFAFDTEHPGGPVAGKIVVTLGGQSVAIDVVGTVEPLTFWERWGRLLLAIGIGTLLLLLLVFVVHGIVSPHSFSSDARLNWGESKDRLKKNEIVIRELPGTGRGFYRNAKLAIGGPSGFPATGVQLATIEATGASQVTITAAEGAELRLVNKFDESKSKPVDGNSAAMHAGEIYQLGELFVRLR